ncbi:dynamin family protein [Bacillus piscicola]|uniref:dynamin family protein n=1 Tax=Bacillus piscicola TaxID=1632684 RepID=UPI001F093121|nr:dynamin family protein [Bacillus piscicola]
MGHVRTKPTLSSSLQALPFFEEDEKRLRVLEKKAEDPYFEVAFCGHFSAGKSTLLNRLLGNEVLPTSPIPTSANIISIQNGPVQLEVVKQDGVTEVWEEEIPWGEAKKWGMDGEAVRAIQIQAPLPFLGDHSKILDTPGVDSTDENHQLVTMDQLLTTDLIVYVSDYNHVQSETNIEFLKQLANENKPIILVINQIDKHDEKELTLQSFENAVRSMLVNFGIKPLEVFFTSMKKSDHPFNQYEKLESYLKSLIYNSSPLREDSLKRLEEGTVLHLVDKLTEEKNEAYEEWQQDTKAAGIDPDDVKQRETWNQELENMDSDKKRAVQDLYKERDQLFQNAILFPYTTTEKARLWLESQQPKFKVGTFFAKGKTKAEQQKRTTDLLDELNDKIKTQLLFHVRNMLMQADNAFLQDPADYEKKVKAVSYAVDEDLLKEFAPDSEIDRHFVFTFTENVSKEIIRHLKRETEDLFQEYETSIARAFQERAAELEEKQKDSESLLKAWENWRATEEQYDEDIRRSEEWLQTHEQSADFTNLLREAASGSYPGDSSETIVITQENESVIAAENDMEALPEKEVVIDDSFLENVRDYLDRFDGREIFTAEKNQLTSLVKQYENNNAVISLFGAFSAGKSSFINAMLGDSVLPVSPHPTTAAVNRIRKSDSDNPHGSVIIHTKTEKFLDDEIKAAARELGISLDLAKIEAWKKPNSAHLNNYQRTYADYLYTLQQSLRQNIAERDAEIQLTLEKLKEWVAAEEKACMIQEVVVYYDCEWTEKGLELIDTPGVNSIHGRHTNVAFEHLRQSDAIFYLTYYNHAFSKADQVFLQQIGRANENFETDKLFFVINAADLADTPYERNGVKQHVREQLQKNGIKEPRLFALSSKEGLKAKQTTGEAPSETGQLFLNFEEYFSRTTWDELKAFHLNKIRFCWENMYNQMKEMLDTLQGDKQKLEAHLQAKQQAAATFTERLDSFDVSYLLPALEEEIQQQCSFLIERTGFMVQDYFAHAINPAVLTGTTKNKQKQELRGALQELEGFTRQYISQEQETIFIRIEERIKQELHAYTEDFLQKEQQEELIIIPPTFQLELQDQWKTFDDVSFHKEKFLQYYKSSKDFFENNRSASLKEAFVEETRKEARRLVTEFEATAFQTLQTYLEAVTQSGRDSLHKEADRELEKAKWMFDPARSAELEEEFTYLQ